MIAGGAPSVVVIEDDHDLQDLVRMVLEPLGWTMVSAYSVAEGLEAIAAVAPDVVVLDLGLPDRPGLDALAALKADPVRSWVPVVVLSGDHKTATATTALLQGAQDYVTKPFAPDELHARLTAALRVSTAHQAVLAANDSERRVSEGLRLAEEELRLTFEEAPIGMAIASLDGRFLRVNKVLCDIVGRSPVELNALRFHDITHPDDIEADVALATRLLAGEIPRYQLDKRFIRPDGLPVWVQLSVSLVHDSRNQPLHAVAHVQDITDLRAARELLLHQSLHDPLTGLPNRRLLTDRLNQALARDARSATGFAVLFVDLDGFKQVNDTLGHDAGDTLLVDISHRLRDVLRPGDTVARLGGDEFIVLAEGVNTEDGAIELAERIRAAVAHPVRLDRDHVVGCTASIGVTLPSHGQEPAEILRHADAAMYLAKQLGKDQVALPAPPTAPA